MAVQIALENQHGGYLINVSFTRAPFEAHFLQMLLGGKGGQPFIPEDDWKTERFCQFSRELRHFLTLRALAAAHMQRLSDYDLMHLVFHHQLSQVSHIAIQLRPSKGWPALRGHEQ